MKGIKVNGFSQVCIHELLLPALQIGEVSFQSGQFAALLGGAGEDRADEREGGFHVLPEAGENGLMKSVCFDMLGAGADNQLLHALYDKIC